MTARLQGSTTARILNIDLISDYSIQIILNYYPYK